MADSAKEVNRITDDAAELLEALHRQYVSSRGEEVEYFSNDRVQRVCAALERVRSVLKETGERSAQLPRAGVLKDAMTRVEEDMRSSPSLQTMLGSSAVQFSGIFNVVLTILRQKDLKKVSGAPTSEQLG